MTLPNFEQLQNQFQKIAPVLRQYLPTESVEKLTAALADKEGNMQPRIMVYGVYNAGKSTLLNALMGQDVATMSDRPETATITPYHWNGYTLLDTPGIDAPEKDEILARAEIDRSDVVLFVVAAGGAIEEKKTWQELTDIVKRDRRVMLIMNDKQGLDDDSLVSVVDKLRINLQQAAENTGIEDILNKVPIRVVKAKTALKGRLENKSLLIASSHIVELEEALALFLRSCDSYTVFERVRNDLSASIVQALSALEMSTTDAETAELLKINQKVVNERNRLDDELIDALNAILPKTKERMIREIQSIVAAKDGAHSEGELEKLSEDTAKRVGEQLNETILLEIPKTQRSLKESIEIAGAELTGIRASKVGVNIEDLKLGSESESANVVMDAVKDSVKNILSKAAIDKLATDGTLFVLKTGKEWLPELFKGIGAKTMGKWASFAGKYAGPIVSVATATYELYSAQQAAEEEKQAIQRRQTAINDVAEDFVGDLRKAYHEKIQEMINELFKPVDEWLAERNDSNTSQDIAIKTNGSVLQSALTELRSNF